MFVDESQLEAVLTKEDLQKDPFTFVAALSRTEQILLLHRYLSFKTWGEMEKHYHDIAEGHIYRPGMTNRQIAIDVLRVVRKLSAYETQKPANLQEALNAYLASLKSAQQTTTTTN